MRPFTSLAGVFLILFVHSISGQTCGFWTSLSGVIYDLSGLTKTSPPNYSGQDANQYTYYWNFCAATFDFEGDSWCYFHNATALQLAPVSGSCTCNGYSNTQVISETAEGVQIVYHDDSGVWWDCGGKFRTTYHLISCDPETDYSLVEITEPSLCDYVIKARSKCACPVNKKPTCGTWVSPRRKQYDLHGLTNVSGDYTGQDANGYKYYWNYCTNSIKSTQCKNGPAPAVLITESSCTPLGYLNNVVWSETGSGLMIEYINNLNDKCGPVSFRSVQHNLVCDPRTEFELVSIKTVQCKTDITVRTKSACPLS